MVFALLVVLPRQLSVAHNNTAVDNLHERNPFYSRSALNASQLDEIIFGVDAVGHKVGSGHPTCGHELSLAWTSKLGASVYSSPLIVPTATSGPAIWANTFVRYAEALDGASGHERKGWPYAFSHATFHTSPLRFDVDEDGIDEMLLLTFEGEVIFLNQEGLPLRGRRYRLPKLRVRKRWYEGLHDIHTMPFKRAGHALVDHGHDDDAPGRAAEPEPSVEPSTSTSAQRAPSDESEFGGDIGAHGALSAEAEASFGLFASELGDDADEAFDEEGGAEEAHAEPHLVEWSR